MIQFDGGIFFQMGGEKAPTSKPCQDLLFFILFFLPTRPIGLDWNCLFSIHGGDPNADAAHRNDHVGGEIDSFRYVGNNSETKLYADGNVFTCFFVVCVVSQRI